MPTRTSTSRSPAWHRLAVALESSIGTDSAVAGTATLTASGDQSTSVDFGDITFYRPGTYTFDVEETTADGGGWTCDHEAHSVTVDVSGTWMARSRQS